MECPRLFHRLNPQQWRFQLDFDPRSSEYTMRRSECCVPCRDFPSPSLCVAVCPACCERGIQDGDENGNQILPFVRCFYGRTSTYLWENEVGDTQEIPQGEGGEQGDPLMPLLFSLGQHPALEAVQDPAPCFQAVRRCEEALHDAGLETPTWREMSESPPERVSQPEPNGPKFGWQHAANRILEEQCHAAHWEELPPPDRALLRSQCGPLVSAALTALPTCRATLIESQPFRVWLCRRLRLPSLSPSATADVAADWTSLATIAQLAPGWGCWGQEVSRWSAPLHKCAEKPEDVLQPT